MELTGIHHLTAVSAAIKENRRFYTQTLGMRLVKRSVNQDDVSAYHLFYADANGSPGTDLTFFDWPVPRERRGTRSIVRTCLRVQGEAALKWCVERFDDPRSLTATSSPYARCELRCLGRATEGIRRSQQRQGGPLLVPQFVGARAQRRPVRDCDRRSGPRGG